LKSKIKVNGKLGNLGDDVAVVVEGDKVAVTATVPFSKR
jgi:large subunit ribosomal protein L22e